MSDKVRIRAIRTEEIPLLCDFLYEAIYRPPKWPTLPRTLIQHPSVWRYIKNFGEQRGDLALVAEVDNMIIGAVWVRYMRGYGHIDVHTPELSIAIYPAYRNKGIGSRLLVEMLRTLQESGITSVSLSVNKGNPAVTLYRRIGFYIHRENDDEYIMVRALQSINRIQ